LPHAERVTHGGHKRNRSSHFSLRYAATFVATIFSLLVVSSARAQAFEVLHDFDLVAGDGNVPYSGLTLDSAGNLYGTTLIGGTHGFGTVFRFVANQQRRISENHSLQL
jgi:uncharacterized repeat protein (TIGR03803 family)